MSAMCPGTPGTPLPPLPGQPEGGDMPDHPVGAKESALGYATRGWAVFPVHSIVGGVCTCGRTDCQAPGKHPRTEHGFKDASTDPRAIDDWWSRWPDANVGIRTGSASDLVVIDIDQPEMPEALRRLLGEAVESAPTVRTGGGLHRYFKHPGGVVRSQVRAMGLPVDVRGDDAYVVAPPSTHVSGEQYSWIASGDSPELPSALLKALQSQRCAIEAPALVEVCVLPVYEGSRNSALMSLAGHLRRAGASIGSISAALHAENQARCRPPLDEAEVDRIVHSISTYPSGLVQNIPQPRKHLRGYTLNEIFSMAPDHTDWKLEGYIAGGYLTCLASKPKTGKTTLVCAAISAMSRNVEFLGRKTASCPIVYLTEENPATLREVLTRTGVGENMPITIVPKFEAYGLQWEEIIEDTRAILDAQERGLLVIDTLPDFVTHSSDWENSSGLAKEVTRPLRQIASDGHAVLCLFHVPKNGGGIRDSIRGSGAFAGDADILMKLEERKGFPRGRVLEGLGRSGATPRLVNIVFDEPGFNLAAEADTSVSDQAERDLLAMLPRDESHAMLKKEILERLSCSDTTADRVLDDLEKAGIVKQKDAKTEKNRNSTAYWLASKE
jgi:hypothetical protein